MSTNAEWAQRFKNVFIPNYQPAELAIDHAEGAEVIDVEGKRYLDLVAGIAVSALGHRHPAVVAAIKAQADRVMHTSNLYVNQPSVELAEKLCEISFAQAIFFCNSGAEANEAAFKLARRRAWDRGEKSRTKILSFDRSFHGRTLGALAATGQPKYHEGFGPMPADFAHLPFGDVEAAGRAIDDRTAAVIVEPIQGEGGVRVSPPGFLRALRELTSKTGALLILDEIQVGLGRTGKMFAYQHEGVTPDIMTLAKSIGGGLPLGAMLTTTSIGEALVYGTHGTTFGGNAVSCAAGRAVVDVISEPGFLDRVCLVADHFLAGLRAIQKRLDVFEDIRGRGFLLGLEIRSSAGFNASDVVRACRERGVLVHVAGPLVIRLAPPLVLSMSDADRALAIIEDALTAIHRR